MSGEVVRHYPIGSHSLLASATNFSCSIEPHFAAPEQTRTIADIFRTCQTYHLYDDILLVLESSHVADVVRDLWKRGNTRILLQYLSLLYFHSVRNHPPPVHNLLNLLAIQPCQPYRRSIKLATSSALLQCAFLQWPCNNNHSWHRLRNLPFPIR